MSPNCNKFWVYNEIPLIKINFDFLCPSRIAIEIKLGSVRNIIVFRNHPEKDAFIFVKYGDLSVLALFNRFYLKLPSQADNALNFDVCMQSCPVFAFYSYTF